MYTIFIYSLKVTAGAFYESSINATVRPQQNSWWIQAICKQEKEIGREKKWRRTLNRVHVTIRIFALSHCLYLKCLFVCVLSQRKLLEVLWIWRNSQKKSHCYRCFAKNIAYIPLCFMFLNAAILFSFHALFHVCASVQVAVFVAVCRCAYNQKH